MNAKQEILEELAEIDYAFASAPSSKRMTLCRLKINGRKSKLARLSLHCGAIYQAARKCLTCGMIATKRSGRRFSAHGEIDCWRC